MDINKLIDELKDKVTLSFDSNEPSDEASYKFWVGVLITREQAELFIKLLEKDIKSVEPQLISCWECEPKNINLKKVKGLFICEECGRAFENGIYF